MIEVKHITKRYGSHLAVDDLSFTIEKGNIYGLLGPNGAGKSTTMNIMTGCLSATSGEVLIDGHDIFKEAKEAKKKIGYLPELPPLYMDMTPYEYLKFVGAAKGLRDEELEDQIADAVEKTKIYEMQNRLIKFLSKGYRQRVGIAQAIIGNPEMIILDEPMVGLDPAQILEVRDLMRELKKDHTVILSSHILAEVNEVCDYVMIIAGGKLIASDTVENLEKHFASNSSLKIELRGNSETAYKIFHGLGISEAVLEKEDGGVCSFSIPMEDESDLREKVAVAFAEERIPVLQMTVDRATLEDVFLELTLNSDMSAITEEGGSDERDI